MILNNRGKVGNIGEIYDSRGCRLYPVGGECFEHAGMDEAVWRGLYPVWCGGMRNLVCRQVPAADSGAGTAKTDGVSFKGQILYASAPLPEALETVGKRMDGALGTLFLETAASLESQPGEPFPVIWRKAVSVMEGKTALSKSDRQTLETLGEHLGFLDRETQERTLLLYLEQVDTELEVLREHRQERCRLYTSLGVMGGLFLAVILV